MIRHLWPTLALAFLAGLAAGSWFSSAAEAVRAAPVAQAPAGTWRSHACMDCVVSLAVTRDAVWAGTISAGVVRHDRRDGSVRQYSIEDGLGGRRVSQVAVGPEGDVWAATRATMLTTRPTGLSHFDGQTWTRFDTTNGLPGNDVRDIAPGAGGTAWVATAAGLAHFNGQRWQVFTQADGLPAGTLSSVASDGVGGAYVGSDQGLAHYDGTRWSAIPLAELPSTRVLDLAVAGEGVLWAVVGPGVGRYNPRGWPSGQQWIFDSLGWSADALWEGDSIMAMPSSRVWVVQNLDIWRFDGQAWQHDDRAAQYAGQTAFWVTVATIGPEEDLWMAFINEGVAHLQGTQWTRVLAQRGPSNIAGFAVTTDPRDQVWLGFFTFLNRDNLVNRYDGRQWTRYTNRDGVPRSGTLGVLPNAVDADANGTVWVGVDEVGVAWFDGRTWASRSITDVVGSPGRLWHVKADDRGGVWLGTDVGAVHGDGRQWRRYTTADGLASNRVNAIAVDRRGGGEVIWFGTDNGVSRWDGTRWTTYTKADGLGFDSIIDIAVDTVHDAVWFASGTSSGGGITRLDGTTWRTYTTADGLSANDAWAIEVGPNGDVWVAVLDNLGTGNTGLGRFDGRRWQMYTTADGLIENTVYDVAVDSRGTVWVATIAGVSEFSPTNASPPGPCVCAYTRAHAPAEAIAAALEHPERVAGWQQPVDPGKPVGPFNPLRECLTMQRIGVEYHPLYNPLTWRAGCP